MPINQNDIPVGDEIILSAELHWSRFFLHYLVMAAAIILLLFQFFIVGLILFFVTLAEVIIRDWIGGFNQMIITTNHLVCTVGVFQKKLTVLTVDQVETVQIEQSLLDRFLDVGSITVVSLGSAVGTLKNVRSPNKFRDVLLSRRSN